MCFDVCMALCADDGSSIYILITEACCFHSKSACPPSVTHIERYHKFVNELGHLYMSCSLAIHAKASATKRWFCFCLLILCCLESEKREDVNFEHDIHAYFSHKWKMFLLYSHTALSLNESIFNRFSQALLPLSREIWRMYWKLKHKIICINLFALSQRFFLMNQISHKVFG